MNWLEIIYKIIIPVIVVIWGWNILMYSRNNPDWIIPPIGITIMIMFFASFILPLIANFHDYTTPQVARSGSIVSLENKSGVSGSVSGGGSFLGSSFSGGVNSTTTCSVLVKWNEKQMTVETIDCSQIIFLEGSDLSVKRFDMVYYYPHSLKGLEDTRWAGYVDHWEITIPAESINKYIKFN